MTGAARLIRNCSVERTLAIVSDTWTFLVLREFYLGAHRFDQIQKVLGMPRSTLSNRLGSLVDFDVIVRVPDPQRNNRHEYRLTPRGRELYLVMLSLLRFGDQHLHGGEPVPLRLSHKLCGQAFQPETACSACGENVAATEVSFRDGAGAGFSLAPPQTQRRRRGEPGAFERNRPSSVSRTLEIIADRWTFLILRELFLGSRRYDRFAAELGVSSAVLAARLGRLTSAGIVRKSKYQDLPERYEYRLTAMGRDLYLPMIQMLHWGDNFEQLIAERTGKTGIIARGADDRRNQAPPRDQMIPRAHQNEVKMHRINGPEHTFGDALVDQATIEIDHPTHIEVGNSPRFILGRVFDQVVQKPIKIRGLGVGRDNAAHMQPQLVRRRHRHVGQAIDLFDIMR